MTEQTYKFRMGILGLAIFVSTFGVGSIVPFLPIYASKMGASGLMLGIIFSSFSASRSLVMPYIGILSDRHGRKPFIVTGLLGTSMIALIMLTADSGWQLAFARMGQGLFAAMVFPVCLALLADVTPTGREGRAFGNFNTAFFLGLGMGPLMGGILFDTLGVDANFIFWAGLCMSSAVLVIFCIKDPPTAMRKAAAAGWGGQLMLIKDRIMLAVFFSRMCSALSWGCGIAFLPMLCLEKGVPNYQVGILLACQALTITVMQKLGGILADRWPRVFLAAAGQIIAGVTRLFMPGARNFEELFILVFLGGIFSGLGVPALTAYTVDRGKTLNVGMGVTMSFFTMALSLGILIGPVSGGALADAIGLKAVFWLAGIATITGALILVLNSFMVNRKAPKVSP